MNPSARRSHELELGLIQTHQAQKQMLRVEGDKMSMYAWCALLNRNPSYPWFLLLSGTLVHFKSPTLTTNGLSISISALHCLVFMALACFALPSVDISPGPGRAFNYPKNQV